MNATAQTAEQSTVAAPGVKIVTAWGAVVFSSWSEVASTVASTLAALYTFLLIIEWLWKKCLRDYAVRRGWAKPKLRRRTDREE